MSKMSLPREVIAIFLFCLFVFVVAAFWFSCVTMKEKGVQGVKGVKRRLPPGPPARFFVPKAKIK